MWFLFLLVLSFFYLLIFNFLDEHLASAQRIRFLPKMRHQKQMLKYKNNFGRTIKVAGGRKSFHPRNQKFYTEVFFRVSYRV